MWSLVAEVETLDFNKCMMKLKKLKQVKDMIDRIQLAKLAWKICHPLGHLSRLDSEADAFLKGQFT